MRLFALCLSLLTLLSLSTISQVPFSVQVEAMQGVSIPAIHSGAIIPVDSEWLFIGGRTNGLHGFQGLSLFPEFTQNSTIYVVDPQNQQRWDAAIETLSTETQEHIRTSNFQYTYNDSLLYILGGYGYSAVRDSFITFPYCTIIRTRELIDAIKNDKPLQPFFTTLYNQNFAVCGGACSKLSEPNSVQVVLGHRFDGIYNKSDSSNLFKQQYQFGSRVFSFNQEHTELISADYYRVQAPRDTLPFRRRDYNLVPQFNGKSYTNSAYSGVFKLGTLLPHTSVIDVDGQGAFTVHNVQQKFAHYECATLPLYNQSDSSMYTIFFGGMAMFYQNQQTQQEVRDTNVPFVNTISVMHRTKSNTFSESILGFLPQLEGTNATFIPARTSQYRGGIQALPMNERVHVGYIVGGIISPKPNISEEDPSLSSASNAIYKVWIDSRTTSVPQPTTTNLAISSFQESRDGTIRITIYSPKEQSATLRIHTTQGKQLIQQEEQLHIGTNTINVSLQCATAFLLTTVQCGSDIASATMLFVR